MSATARGLMALLALAVVGIGTVACRSVPFLQGPEKITIGTLAHELNGLVYIAQENRNFAANGLEVAVKTYGTGIDTTDALLRGEVDIAGCAEFILVGRALKNENMRTIATIAKSDDQYVLARVSRGIGKVGDLRGKRVGVPQGTVSEFYLGRFLDLHGMNIRDVQLVDVKPAEMLDRMLEDKADAVVAWEPYAGRIRERLQNDVVAWPAQSSQVLYWNLVATDAWIRSHSQAITRLLGALAQAELVAQEDPGRAKKIVQKKLNYDDAYAETFWANNRYALVLDQSLIIAMEDETRWMINNGLAPGRKMPDYGAYVYLDGLLTVKPSAVKIVR